MIFSGEKDERGTSESRSALKCAELIKFGSFRSTSSGTVIYSREEGERETSQARCALQCAELNMIGSLRSPPSGWEKDEQATSEAL